MMEGPGPGACACCGAPFAPTGCTVPLYREAAGRPGAVETAWWPLFRCRGCGSLYAEVDDASFASHLAMASYTDPVQEAAFRERRVGFFRWIAGLVTLGDAASGRVAGLRTRTDPRVLDFGCSYGHLLEAFGERGWALAGVESTDRARETARRNLPGATLAATLDGVDGPFDAVTMIDVLYCLRRPGDVLAALRARMAPGGTLVVRTTNRVWLYRALRLLGRDRLPTAVMGSARWAFTREGLRRLLASAGFTGVRFHEAEEGKRFADRRVALYYGVTQGVARITRGRVALQGGIFVTARSP